MAESPVTPLECICEEGEVIFVPSGWWHIVFNLEESVAITQNYCSRRNLLSVLDFLDNKPDQISGTHECEYFRQTFPKKFEEAYPGEIARLKQERDAERASRQSLWDKIKAPARKDASTATAISPAMSTALAGSCVNSGPAVMCATYGNDSTAAGAVRVPTAPAVSSFSFGFDD